MLGSNPSADQGPTPMRGNNHVSPFPSSLSHIGMVAKAINPGGLGAGPHVFHPLKTRKTLNFSQGEEHRQG